MEEPFLMEACLMAHMDHTYRIVLKVLERRHKLKVERKDCKVVERGHKDCT